MSPLAVAAVAGYYVLVLLVLWNVVLWRRERRKERPPIAGRSAFIVFSEKGEVQIRSAEKDAWLVYLYNSLKHSSLKWGIADISEPMHPRRLDVEGDTTWVVIDASDPDCSVVILKTFTQESADWFVENERKFSRSMPLPGNLVVAEVPTAWPAQGEALDRLLHRTGQPS